MAIFRSTIKPVPRKKRGKTYWYARGHYPERMPNGDIERKRHSEGLGDRTASERQKFCDDLNQSYEEAARATTSPRRFKEAMTVYLAAKHPEPYWKERLLLELGEIMCHKINLSHMTTMTEKYAAGLTASYINRHYYTPVMAILELASIDGCCPAPNWPRPNGHKAVKAITIPEGPSWYAQVSAHLSVSMQALLLALVVHGGRLGEFIERSPEDFRPEAKTLQVGKTKNGDPILIDLQDDVVAAMLRMPNWQKRKWLFGILPARPSTAREAIQRACKKAGVKYYSPHKLGRHAFATRLLRQGYSLEHVRKAGRWKTIEQVSRRYGHLATAEITKVVHDSGAAFLADMRSAGAKMGDTLHADKTAGQKVLPARSSKAAQDIEIIEGQSKND